MKRVTITIIMGVLILKGIITGQSTSDTIGLYSNGRIKAGWESQKRHKIFNGKTILLQEKFHNGNLSKEYLRNNDSTFLYVEYYEHPDTSIQYKSPNWTIKREGYIIVSNQTTGDTIASFDPETYAEHIYMDTLLLPFGKWTFYYPDGEKKIEGTYLNGKRIGLWKFYDEFRYLNKELKYDKGKVIKIEPINRIEDKSLKITKNHIEGIWVIHDYGDNESYKPNPKFLNYRFMYKIQEKKGIGDIYSFMDDGELEYIKTRTVKTEYKKGDKGLLITRMYDTVRESKGTWKLTNYNEIEFSLNGNIEQFKVEYVSDKELRLRKIVNSPRE